MVDPSQELIHFRLTQRLAQEVATCLHAVWCRIEPSQSSAGWTHRFPRYSVVREGLLGERIDDRKRKGRKISFNEL